MANDVPMSELLKQNFPKDFCELDYPDLSGIQKKGRLPPPRPTKSSRLFEDACKTSTEEFVQMEKAHETFKLRKFRNIEAKVSTTRQ
eukprot:CAMPEP_0194272372 /NCGR_PEP_ID=MMETSP0169-20130528/5963_1 /TAXON_ID=218684 /ORGANISM="Corethron pennatum, Strain L29A3" /LENGTH=86 /DNA_ID=CAMNT_0039015017 /DNA_START=746 /DNA_END=1006 /DNA_ORIENTATION=+